MDKFMFWWLWSLSVGNLVTGLAEHVGWWGNPSEPHVSHTSIALVWCVLAVLWRRTSVSATQEDGE